MNEGGQIFYVEHAYENNGEEEIKFIGTFSSYKKAQDAVDELSRKPGFRDLPLDCFNISEGKLDRIGWQDGFTRWNEAP